MYHFHTKLPHQKPMLWQIVCWLQNGPITRNGVFYLFIYFFWKFCFGLTTSYKKLMCCTNNPNVIIFVHFASAGVLFHGAFSLWVSLKHPDMQVWFATYLKRFPFFYLQSFCFVLPFWITNLKANNFSRKIILKRQ